MKDNLAMLLAVAALGISIWSASSRPAKLEPAVEGESAHHLTAMPKVDSTTTPDCGAPGSITSLKGLMRGQVNPAMTHLSFALYHDQGGAAERGKTIADSAGKLLGCIHLAPTLPPAEIGLTGLPDYFRFLSSMQENALGVQVAAMEEDFDAARHWFGHLKQDCAACHSRFRIDPAPDAAK